MTDVYAAVEAVARDATLPTAAICDTLGVCRAEPGLRQQELEELTPTIGTIFRQHRRRYGARRSAAELKDRALVCSAKRVAQVLKHKGLGAIQPRSFVAQTTHSRPALGYSPNRVREAADSTRVNDLWVANITYLPLRGGGFCYLAGLMDWFSRDIVGWSIDKSMTESLVLEVRRQAIRARQLRAGLMHPSDGSGQSAGTQYRGVLRRAGMSQSMSRAANCSDNGFMESCWGGAFRRELEMADYESVTTARKIVAAYVRYYRFERKPSSLDYLIPHEFET